MLGITDREKVPPRDSEAWKTPLFDQYWKAKDGVPGALLFFRLGDFYELFGEDAVLAAPILEVQLTSRHKGQKDAVPMCGVPAHAVDSYTEKLLARGLKIALCEQVSEPGKTKLVEREVIRVLTPGLPTDFQRLDSKEPHWFYSLALNDQTLEVSLFDFLAAKLFEGEIKSDEELQDLFLRARPQEILVAEEILKSKTRARDWPSLQPAGAHYSKITPWIGKRSRGNLEEYLKYTQKFTDEGLASFLPQARSLFEIIQSGASQNYARLPTAVLEQWNLFPELFELLDACGSAVGSRRLRELLSRPLVRVDRLRTRQNLLRNFAEYKSFLDESRAVFDFERILGRFRIGVAQPLELFRFQAALDHSLKALALVAGQTTWRQFFESESLSGLDECMKRLALLLRQLDCALDTSVDVVRATDLNLLVKKGFDGDLDALKATNETASQWLVDFEVRLRARTGIPSLKVRFNKVFGYYIEVTNTHVARVPSTFQRKQTTVNGERFTCEELTLKEREILTAQSRVEAKARELLESLQKEILAAVADIQSLIDHFAWADAWAGLRRSLLGLQAFGAWNYPNLVESEQFFFSVTDSRHPILAARDRDFVSNSISIGGAEKPIVLLTGPNMAGKSTFMRQCGLCVLLAQCGLPVPASEMTLSPASGFYSRMGASDRILSGESTFMVEMKECSQILRDADRNSFLLLDEIGRGTSTQDGLAIARAILKHIHDSVMAPTIFATHYHELSLDAESLKGARNASLGIREFKGRLHFLRKLDFRPAESSYGIYVAKLAGLPPALLKTAEEYFRQNLKDESLKQLSLFSNPATPIAPVLHEPAIDPRLEAIAAEIREVDVLGLSPKEAWTRLERWALMLGEIEQTEIQSGGTSPESPVFLES